MVKKINRLNALIISLIFNGILIFMFLISIIYNNVLNSYIEQKNTIIKQQENAIIQLEKQINNTWKK